MAPAGTPKGSLAPVGGEFDEVLALLDAVRSHPTLRGFNRPNLFRMRHCYETCRTEEKVSPLVRQLPWNHDILILSHSKRPKEREFYLRMAIQERRGNRVAQPTCPHKNLRTTRRFSIQQSSQPNQ